MNVFVLSTGRCGSTTFAKACRHIDNFTVGHESRSRVVGPGRLDYPKRHVEVDNRLSWMLGRLEEKYGDSAYYVHLTRDIEKVAESYSKRTFRGGIMKAYYESIIMQGDKKSIKKEKKKRIIEVAKDMVKTVNSNIDTFLEDKKRSKKIRIEDAKKSFKSLWNKIGAKGELKNALSEFDKKYNESKDKKKSKKRGIKKYIKKMIK